MASPIFFIIVSTSAKSRFITPWTLIKSEIPFAAWCKIVSAIWKASGKVVDLSTIDISFWLGIAINVSQAFFISAIPSRALFILLGPSKLKGSVTIPTVNTPSSLEICEITGAAPVPVPPPIPAVMNTMSAPSIKAIIASLSASTASLPTLEFAPAPNPLVKFFPTCILCSDGLLSKSWASVFIAIKSTPCIPDVIILVTAFPPAPPTPTTFNFAFCSLKLSNSNSMIISFIYWFG